MASAAARSIPCPSCSAQAGNSCTMEAENGSRQFSSTYHLARIIEAQTIEIPEEIPA